MIGINSHEERFDPNTYFSCVVPSIKDGGYKQELQGEEGEYRKKIWKNWYLLKDGFVVETLSGLGMDGVSEQFLVDFFHNPQTEETED